MRIALVIESFDPAAGGNERSTAQIAHELRTRGHDVTILTGRAPQGVAVEGVAIQAMATRKSSSPARLLRFAKWARRQLDEGGFDVSLSVTNAVVADVLQPRGGMVRETLERNIAMRANAMRRLSKRMSLAIDPKQRLLLAMERKTIADPRVRRIVAVSGYVVEQLQRHYGVSGEKVELIHNGAVMPAIDARQRDHWREQIRGSYRIPSDATVYLFAATNPKLKGLDTLLRATKLLTQRGLNPVLLIAGSDQPMTQLGAVNSLALRGHVRIVGPTRQMPALYAAADVTVLPTWYDPSSKVVLESLMMGTPAISTASNGASDFIRNDGGEPRGRVIDNPADAAALADAMAELADPQARAACALACSGMRELLSMAWHVDRLERVLREAAEVSGAAARPVEA